MKKESFANTTETHPSIKYTNAMQYFLKKIKII